MDTESQQKSQRATSLFHGQVSPKVFLLCMEDLRKDIYVLHARSMCMVVIVATSIWVVTQSDPVHTSKASESLVQHKTISIYRKSDSMMCVYIVIIV